MIFLGNTYDTQFATGTGEKKNILFLQFAN